MEFYGHGSSGSVVFAATDQVGLRLAQFMTGRIGMPSAGVQPETTVENILSPCGYREPKSLTENISLRP
jgi:hypothetical protein